MRGNRAWEVGHIVEGLRAQGAFVFHDVVGARFNLDHVVVHTSGIYVAIVFPGRWVERTAEATTSYVWAINPKQLLSKLKAAPVRLSPEDVNLCKFHLDRYIRSP